MANKKDVEKLKERISTLEGALRLALVYLKNPPHEVTETMKSDVVSVEDALEEK